MSHLSSESSYKSEFSYKDTNTILLENRIINLVGEIDDAMAYRVTSALHILNNENSTRPIQLFINSPGGSVTAGLSIIDTMNYIDAPVYTICTGEAASMGAGILSAGEKGHRYSLPNATIMVHQASGGAQGNIQDAEKTFEYFKAINNRLAEMIAENCGMTKSEYLKKTQRDYFMFPEDALKFGIIDEIINNKEKSKD